MIFLVTMRHVSYDVFEYEAPDKETLQKAFDTEIFDTTKIRVGRERERVVSHREVLKIDKDYVLDELGINIYGEKI